MVLPGFGHYVGTPQPEGEGGAPPEQARTPFVSGLIQEMGGNPQDLRSPPPTQDKAKGGGGREDGKGGTGVGVDASLPLGGRGTPEEQARAIVAWISNLPPGGGPHSGQTPATPQRAQHIRGAGGRGGIVRRGGKGDGGQPPKT